jgi:GNAT superfamily N-acetyltransferase
VARISALTDDDGRDHIEALSALLLSCVREGASIGYMADIDANKARQYWDLAFQHVRAGHSLILVAQDPDQTVLGTVQIYYRMIDNQVHRGEVQMLLVDPAARRRGVGRALMNAVELAGRTLGKRLLTLYTAQGAASERLYLSLGYKAAGVIPAFALWPDGTDCDYVIYWKTIAPTVPAPIGNNALI